MCRGRGWMGWCIRGIGLGIDFSWRVGCWSWSWEMRRVVGVLIRWICRRVLARAWSIIWECKALVEKTKIESTSLVASSFRRELRLRRETPPKS